VVCFYPDDLPKIEALIRKEFEISEKEDKVQVKEVDRFGYSATHFIVRLSKRAAGARYDDLKDKICEIQVRTVLQDAWGDFLASLNVQT
jgi:ppGpp synthetase/RelA/SpoT-type nucleotidyltranferase